MDNQTEAWLDHVKKHSMTFSKDDLAIVIETLFQVGKINAEEYQQLLNHKFILLEMRKKHEIFSLVFHFSSMFKSR